MSHVLRPICVVSVMILFSLLFVESKQADAQEPNRGVATATFIRGDLSLQTSNFNRQTIVEYWRGQVRGNQPLTYPTLRLDRNAQVGDVGIGDANAMFTMVQRLPKNNYLLSRSGGSTNSKPELFQFRGYDFARFPAGSQLSAPQLSEITGTRKFKDKQKRIQTALIVQRLEPKDLALPVGKSADEIIVPQKAKPPTKKQEPKLRSGPLEEEDDRPRFVKRKWLTSDGDRSITGTLVGVASEAVWIKIAGGKVLRIKMSSLHPSDRSHAIKKKQAILDYRRTH